MIKNRSKIDPKSIKNRPNFESLNGISGVAHCGHNIRPTQDPQHAQKGSLLEAKLGPSCAQNPLGSCLNFSLRFGSSFGASWARFWKHVGLQNRVQNQT